MNLVSRLEALERAPGATNDLIVRVVRFAQPGADGVISNEPTGYRCPQGRRWTRNADESVEDLRNRAVAEYPRNPNSMAVLIEVHSAQAASDPTRPRAGPRQQEDRAL